jgi:hypothetical protein
VGRRCHPAGAHSSVNLLTTNDARKRSRSAEKLRCAQANDYLGARRRASALHWRLGPCATVEGKGVSSIAGGQLRRRNAAFQIAQMGAR